MATKKEELKKQYEARKQSYHDELMEGLAKRCQQFHEMKRKHPDAVLLFRVGDFYESYYEDAQIVTEIIPTITLVMKEYENVGTLTYCGFPHHALDMYLPKIVRANKRVAICEQLIDPKDTLKLKK